MFVDQAKELDTVQDQYDEMVKKHDDLNENKESNAAELSDQLRSLQEANEVLKAQNAEQEDKMETIKAKLETLQSEKELLVSDLGSKDSDKQRVEDQISSLTAQFEDEQKKFEAIIESRESEIGDLHDQLDQQTNDHEAKIKELDDKIQDMAAKLASELETREELEQVKNDLEKQIEALRNEIAELTKKDETEDGRNIEMLKEKLKTLRHEVSSLKVEKIRTDDAIQKLTKRHAAEVNGEREQVKRLKDEMRRLMAQKSSDLDQTYMAKEPPKQQQPPPLEQRCSSCKKDLQQDKENMVKSNNSRIEAGTDDKCPLVSSTENLDEGNLIFLTLLKFLTYFLCFFRIETSMDQWKWHHQRRSL